MRDLAGILKRRGPGWNRGLVTGLNYFRIFLQSSFLIRTTCGADITATISRSAFGMTSYATFIGDEVRLVIQIEAVKEESAPQPSTLSPGG